MWTVLLAAAILASVAGSPCCISENKDDKEPPQKAQKPANNKLTLKSYIDGETVNAKEIVKLIENMKISKIDWKYIGTTNGNDFYVVEIFEMLIGNLTWITLAGKTQKAFIYIEIVTQSEFKEIIEFKEILSPDELELFAIYYYCIERKIASQTSIIADSKILF